MIWLISMLISERETLP